MSEVGSVKTVILEESISNISVGMSSVIGKRKDQQDTIKADDEYALLEEGKFIAVLCDGMGGLSGGKLASETAASFIVEAFHSERCVEDIGQFYRGVVAESDRRVVQLRDDNGNPLKAGTTMASIAIVGDKLHWASVGDSHIYLIRNNHIQCITNDHNYLMTLNQKVKNGEITQQEANTHPKREALISYLGINGVKYLDLNAEPFQLRKGDYIILCSDGLYRTVSEKDIKDITYGIGDADDVATCLTAYAMQARKAHQDNTSVIVVQYNG